MNTIILQGRLTADPMTTPAGKTTITRFTLAVDRQWKKDGNQETDFIRCEAWGKYPGETIANHFTKGGNILVNGRLKIDSYKDKNGNNARSTVVVVEQMHFSGASKPGSTQAQKPVQQAQQVSQEAAQTTLSESEIADIYASGDELPF